MEKKESLSLSLRSSPMSDDNGFFDWESSKMGSLSAWALQSGLSIAEVQERFSRAQDLGVCGKVLQARMICYSAEDAEKAGIQPATPAVQKPAILTKLPADPDTKLRTAEQWLKIKGIKTPPTTVYNALRKAKAPYKVLPNARNAKVRHYTEDVIDKILSLSHWRASRSSKSERGSPKKKPSARSHKDQPVKTTHAWVKALNLRVSAHCISKRLRKADITPFFKKGWNGRQAAHFTKSQVLKVCQDILSSPSRSNRSLIEVKPDDLDSQGFLKRDGKRLASASTLVKALQLSIDHKRLGQILTRAKATSIPVALHGRGIRHFYDFAEVETLMQKQGSTGAESAASMIIQ
jgi:hypothetical protein